jgi:hypothetical protein
MPWRLTLNAPAALTLLFPPLTAAKDIPRYGADALNQTKHSGRAATC